MSDQDIKILSSLMEEDNRTAYSISQHCKISIPQTTFRLSKLIECGVVVEKKEDNKTVYNIRHTLKSKEIVDKITTHIQKIVDLITGNDMLDLDGIHVILEFILSKVDIEDDFVLEEKERLIDIFKKDITKYAKENELEITSIAGWTESKIRWMACNDRLCACIPDGSRHCPCPQGLEEVKIKGRCTCSLFASKSWITKTTKNQKKFLN